MEIADERQENSFNVPPSSETHQREEQWEHRTAELRRITDALGKPIDAGILDTVVALNLFDIQTTQSCEGHLDHGTAAPWVQVQVPETDEIRELHTQVDALSETIETLEREEKPDTELTPYYKKLNALLERMRRPQLQEIQKVVRLLREFYQTRQVDYERLLTIHGNKLESQGTPLQEILSSEQRGKKFDEYQQEIKDFTAFLKAKFVSS